MPRVRWPALAISPTQEIASNVDVIAALVADNQNAIAALQGLWSELDNYVEKAGDDMSGNLTMLTGKQVVFRNLQADVLPLGSGYRLRASGAENFRVDMSTDGGVTWVERLIMFNEGGFSLYDENGARRFNVTSAGAVEADDDGSSGLVEIFPKGTLIDMGTDVDATPGAWTTTEASRHSKTVTCDYASQPVYVQLHVMARFGNDFPTNGYAYIRGGVAGSAVGYQARFEVPQLTGSASLSGSVSSGGDNTDIDGSSGSPSPNTTTTDDGHFHQLNSHTHTSGSFAVNGTHSHGDTFSISDTFAIDSDRLTVQWTRFFEATADGSGDLVLDLFGEVAGDATSETPEAEIINYAVWRR